MKRVLTALSILVALPTYAGPPEGDFDCRSVSSCAAFGDDVAMECDPSENVMLVRQKQGSTYKIGWKGQGMTSVTRIAGDEFAIFDSRNDPETMMTLMVGKDMRATHSVFGVMPIVEKSVIAHTSLICEVISP